MLGGSCVYIGQGTPDIVGFQCSRVSCDTAILKFFKSHVNAVVFSRGGGPTPTGLQGGPSSNVDVIRGCVQIHPEPQAHADLPACTAHLEHHATRLPILGQPPYSNARIPFFYPELLHRGHA